MKTRNLKNRVVLPVVVVTVAAAFLLSGQERSDVILLPTPDPQPPSVSPSGLCFTDILCDATGFHFGVAWPTTTEIPNSAFDLYGSTNLLSREPEHWQHLGTRIDVPVSRGWDAFSLPYASLPSGGAGWEKSGFFIVATQLEDETTPLPFEDDPFEWDVGHVTDAGLIGDYDGASVWFDISRGEKKDLTDILFSPWAGLVTDTLLFPLQMLHGSMTGISIAPNGLISFSAEWGSGRGWIAPVDLTTADRDEISAKGNIPFMVAGFWGDLMRAPESAVTLAYVTAGGFRHCVIEFRDMQVSDPEDPATPGKVSFQVVFRENVADKILVLFKDVQGCGDGRAATIGTWSTAVPLQYGFKEACVKDGLMLYYVLPQLP